MRRRIAVGFGVAALACITAIAAVSVASGSSSTALRPVFGLQPGVRPEPARSPGLHNPRVLVLTLHSAQGSNVDADPAASAEVLRHVGKRAIPQLVIDGEWFQPYKPGRGLLYDELYARLRIQRK